MGLGRNDELIILKSGSSAIGNNSFSNLVGTGSNKHVVCGLFKPQRQSMA